MCLLFSGVYSHSLSFARRLVAVTNGPGVSFGAFAFPFVFGVPVSIPSSFFSFVRDSWPEAFLDKRRGERYRLVWMEEPRGFGETVPSLFCLFFFFFLVNEKLALWCATLYRMIPHHIPWLRKRKGVAWYATGKSGSILAGSAVGKISKQVAHADTDQATIEWSHWSSTNDGLALLVFECFRVSDLLSSGRRI